jgi:FKBP-type peptidyl-prolyl cis-trans isomerase SlyD
MQVAKHAVVEIDYTLTDDDGNVLDTSKGGHPLAYLHGAGNLIPGLESALEGKSAGDSLQVSVPPERAYGKRDDALVQEVPRSQFGSVKDLSVGMQFQATSNAGTHIVRVVEITDAVVTVDANHELAGQNLNFDVNVVNVRKATPEELQHGHVHGPGCHHH